MWFLFCFIWRLHSYEDVSLASSTRHDVRREMYTPTSDLQHFGFWRTLISFSKILIHELVNISPQHHLLPSMFNLTVMLDYFRIFFSSKRKQMEGLPWCVMVVPFRSRVSRWSTKGRSVAGSLRSAVRMSGGGKLCADWGGITHDWTTTESSDGARAAWLTSPVCYIMYKALLNPFAI